MWNIIVYVMLSSFVLYCTLYQERIYFLHLYLHAVEDMSLSKSAAD